MSYIVRIQADPLVEKLLASEEEVIELSPLETFDNNGGEDEEPQIIEFEMEKGFEKKKTSARLKDTLKLKGNEKEEDGKSDTTELGRP